MTQLISIRSSKTAKIDVIFVHGLGGSWNKTWGFGGTQSWDNWLSDRLDIDIWSLDYRIHPTDWQGGSMPLTDRATNVLATLDGVLDKPRPILFICHSYGGLLVKQMLRSASDTATIYQSLADRTAGIVFLGTPHTGALLANYAKGIDWLLRTAESIKELEFNDQLIRNLNDWFRTRSGSGIEILVFFETIKTGPVIVVDATSANPGWPSVPLHGVDANHTEMARPQFSRDLRVTQTRKFLERIIERDLKRSPNENEFGIEAAAFYRTCFDRPAFSTPFFREDHQEDFKQAIEDTIIAIKTGTLIDRKRGTPLMQGPSLARLDKISMDKMVDIIDLLSSILKEYNNSVYRNKQGGTGIRIFEYNGTYYKPERDLDTEEFIDKTRLDIINAINKVIENTGIKKLPASYD